MVLCRVATSAQRGQPSIGLRPHCPTEHMPSDPSAPSAPQPSAPPAGRDSSSRAPSTSRHSSVTTIKVTGRYLSFIHFANVDQCSVWRERCRVSNMIKRCQLMQLQVEEPFPLFILRCLFIGLGSRQQVKGE